jgi:hypothetical protein
VTQATNGSTSICTDRGALEIALLRLCARVDVTDRALREIDRLLDGDIDWSLFVDLANRHAVLALAHRTLSRLDEGRVPKEVARNLAIQYLFNADNNQKLSRELASVAGACADRQVEIMPVKGPLLAKSAYGSLALRKHGDLDILIRTKDIESATEALLSLGYRMPETAAPTEQRRFIGESIFMESAANARQLLFFRGDDMLVELHWEIGTRYFQFALDNDGIWRHAIPTRHEGGVVFTLPPALMLLLLVYHGSKHAWQRLSWICDIAEFVTREPNLDWSDLAAKTRRFQMTTMLAVVLRMASTWLECPLPPAAMPLLKTGKKIDRLVDSVDRDHRSFGESSSQGWHEHLFRIQCSDRLPARLRYLSFVLTTPTGEEWSMLQLPKALTGFYPAVRFARVATLLASACFPKSRRR